MTYNEKSYCDTFWTKSNPGNIIIIIKEIKIFCKSGTPEQKFTLYK